MNEPIISLLIIVWITGTVATTIMLLLDRLARDDEIRRKGENRIEAVFKIVMGGCLWPFILFLGVAENIDRIAPFLFKRR